MIFYASYKLTQFHRVKNWIFLENLEIIETFYAFLQFYQSNYVASVDFQS